MKLLKILTLIIGVTIFEGCTTTRYINSHVAVAEPGNPCIFKKFTEEEKDSMTENVGRKIHWNQQSCFIQQKANRARIQAHNELHK